MSSGSPPGPDRVELLDGWADLSRRVAVRGEQRIDLTEKESRLLGFLASHAPQQVTRQALLSEVWGYHPDVRSRTLDTTVRRLRRKIEPAPDRPQLVQTVTGVGYRYVPPPPVPVGTVADVPRPAPRARVPSDVSALRGRQAERSVIRQHLEDARVVCVCGPGGVGKSHLARSVAHAWSTSTGRDAWWVSADGVHDLDTLVKRIARALSLRLAGEDSPASLGARLGRMGPLLLALDGADVLGPDALRAVRDWGVAGDDLRIVLTRRGRPEGSWPVLRLRPLDREVARELFLERVRQRLPSFEASPEGLQALLDSLGGLPLAVHLAAARVRILGLQGLQERLSQGQDVLRDWADPGEHGSLQRVLDRSWELLPDGLQEAAALLCRLHGPFQLPLAEALLDDGAARLEALVDSGWVELRPVADEAWFEVLDCVRGHVVRQADSGPPSVLVEVLSREVRARLDPLFGPVTASACAWLRRRADDLEACLDPAAPDPWLALATGHALVQIGDDTAALERWTQAPGLAAAWLARAQSTLLPPDERGDCLDRASALDPDDPRLQAAVQLVRGRLLGHLDADRDRALVMLERALATFEALDDDVGVADTCRELANQYGWRCDWDRTAAVRARGLARAGTSDSLFRLELLVAPYPLPRDQQPTLPALRDGVAIAEAAGDRRLHVRLLTVVAMQALGVGRVEQALESVRAAVDAVGGLQSPSLRSGVLGNAAIVLRELACFDEATACFMTVLDGLHEGAHAEARIIVALNLALLHLDQGRLEVAQDVLGAARPLATTALAAARLDQLATLGDALAARDVAERFRANLADFRALEAPTHTARTLVFLAAGGAPDADVLLDEARELAQRYDERGLERAAEAVWMARGHAAWSTPPRDRPPPERWLTLVRIVRRLHSGQVSHRVT